MHLPKTTKFTLADEDEKKIPCIEQGATIEEIFDEPHEEAVKEESIAKVVLCEEHEEQKEEETINEPEDLLITPLEYAYSYPNIMWHQNETFIYLTVLANETLHYVLQATARSIKLL